MSRLVRDIILTTLQNQSDRFVSSCQRAGQLHNTLVCFFHRSRAINWRVSKEPGCYESCQHDLRYQVSHTEIFRSGLNANDLSRRLIGRRFDDPTVKKDIESWPFKVVDQGGNPMVQVEYLGETKTFSPQEISSMVLMKACQSVLQGSLMLTLSADERSCRD